MDKARTKQMRQLLERLGRAIHASIADSDDVNGSLSELRSNGWDAMMFLEASLGRRYEGNDEPSEGVLRIHVGNTDRRAEYQLGSDDARWLAAIGISPTRYRSHPQRPLPPLEQWFPPARGDG